MKWIYLYGFMVPKKINSIACYNVKEQLFTFDVTSSS